MFQSMNGFLFITTTTWKLVYVSENVNKYLGHATVQYLYIIISSISYVNGKIRNNKININKNYIGNGSNGTFYGGEQ